jgi:WD40 repeat protein
MHRTLPRFCIVLITFVLLTGNLKVTAALAEETNVCSGSYRGHRIGFSPDGKYVYAQWGLPTLDQDFQYLYVVWETNTGKVVRTFPTTSISEAAISPDSKYFAMTNGTAHEVNIINFETGNTVSTVKLKFSNTWKLVFLPGTNRIMPIEFGRAILWDFTEDKLIRSFDSSSSYHGIAPEVSADGKYLLADADNGILVLWRIDTGEMVHSFDEFDYTFAGAISPNSKLVGVNSDTSLLIWDLETQTSRSIQFPADMYNQRTDRRINAFSPDNRYVVINAERWATNDLSGRMSAIYFLSEVWDLELERKIFEFGDRISPAVATFFLEQESLLVVTPDGFQVWHLKTGDLEVEGSFWLPDYWRPDDRGMGAAISPDKKYLLSHAVYDPMDSDKAPGSLLTLRDITTGGKIRTLCYDPQQFVTF